MKSKQSFPKTIRLLSRGDFRKVYERRCWLSDDQLKMAGELNDLSHPRLGLAVSRQIGHAVLRNRWKRLIREAFRLARPDLPSGLDFIVVPRGATEPQLQPLAKSLTNLSWRLAKRLKREQAQARRNTIQDRQQESDS